MKIRLVVILLFIVSAAFSQVQTCPININFSTGDLSHWYAYTGSNANGNGPSAILKTYDSTVAAPTGTLGTTSISEYNLSSVPGIQTLVTASIDPFGGYATVPTINGYQYNYSIKLGSTSVTSNGSSNKGGYVRGVSYQINVPNVPLYTMTYAYAMVLEGAPHQTSQVPLFSATLNTSSGSITCASAFYQLPTIAQGGSNYVPDPAAAAALGFSLSNTNSPNIISGSPSQRVWTKGWTEVTFDLSPYRGQKVTLTFEADNCVPGGHFAYAYIAFRNACNGLSITGDTIACSNSPLIYSVPSLAGANYNWTVPPSWSITSGANTNIITVVPGNTNGLLIAQEQNSCANLFDTIHVSATTPTIPGNLNGNNTVCAGFNNSPIILSGNNGHVLNWLASTDGINWNVIKDTTNTYTAVNLNTTTQYKAIIQNGKSCAIDTTSSAIITVNPSTVSGTLLPANISICQGQNKGAILALTGYTGNILNWQSSLDSITWNNFSPAKTDSLYNINNVNVPTYFRAIIQSGTCNASPSNATFVGIFSTPFPQAISFPVDTTICFATPAYINPIITTGTNYTWSNPGLLFNAGNGIINSNPFYIHAIAAPSKATNYIITITNAGCPNPLVDTFHVNVTPPITANAGNDTSIIVNQPLQLNATVSSSDANIFSWTPEANLNFSNIHNPIATFNSTIDSIRYFVKATTAAGCYGESSILIHVFKAGPEIYVPSAFTPNGDGKNDILKPITVGIKTLVYFKVFNRWGQLIYTTSQIGQGWDGTLNGTPQQSGAYVYITQGIDYNGKIVLRKGTSVLIR